MNNCIHKIQTHFSTKSILGESSSSTMKFAITINLPCYFVVNSTCIWKTKREGPETDMTWVNHILSSII